MEKEMFVKLGPGLDFDPLEKEAKVSESRSNVGLSVMPTLDNKKILDVCCGSKMFWFDRGRDDVIYGDIREEQHTLCDGRDLKIAPDIKLDFRDLPLESNIFTLVVFDPPHLDKLGKNSWMAKKYGVLDRTWKDDIRAGFKECFRVLKKDGILIFKWNEMQIKTSEILKLSDVKPLFGNISGKASNTHWITFINT